MQALHSNNNSNNNNNVVSSIRELPSPQSALEYAAELNEDGVYELADGSFDDAVQSFENALRQLMHLSSVKSSTASSSSSDPLPPTRAGVEVPFLSDDLFYLYGCTVTFQAPSSTTSSGTATEVTFCAAAILFNMALAYHQRGQQQQQQQQQLPKSSITANNPMALLQQALTLYQECSKALQALGSSAQHDHCHNDDVVLLQLAALNNQAHILYTLDPTYTNMNTTLLPLVQTLLQQSLAVLQHNSASSGNNNYNNNYSATATHCNFSPFEQSQIHEFVRNALVLGLQPTSAAPCA